MDLRMRAQFEVDYFDQSLKNQMLALLPSVWRINDITPITLEQFISDVASQKHKETINLLRLIKKENPAKYSLNKKKLLAVAFGSFKEVVRNDNYIPYSSCIFNGDFDGPNNADLVEELLELLKNHPNVVYCFKSPSNFGIKFGIHVGAIKNDAHYKNIFRFINIWIKSEIHPDLMLDQSCKDLRRLIFISHDPDAYLNLEAEILAIPAVLEKSEAKNEIQQVSLPTPIMLNNLDSVQDDCLGVVTNTLIKAKAGERHRIRLKVAKLAGGFVAGGLVDKDIIWNRLIGASDRIADNGITNPTELKALSDGFENGLLMPISHKMFLQEHTGHTKGISLFESNDLCMDESSVEVNFETTKSGRIKATLNNLHKALNNPQFSDINVAYDMFKDQIMYYVGNSSKWLPLTDDAYTKFRIELPKLGFEEIPAPLMKDVVNFTAKQNKFDSAQQWLNGLEWDGEPRIKNFNSVYFNTVDTPYTQAAGLYMWTALAGRTLDPGCQSDMVPVYEGAQGDGKSTAVAAIAPNINMTTEISFLDDEDKTSRKMRGCLVAEIAELRGIGTKDAESIKAFITRRYDRLRPLYQEFTTDIPRRCIFIGTTNQKDFLGDASGERRWLPLSSGKVDTAGIIRDRDQLWAEAAVIYKEKGVCWQEAQELAPNEHGDFTYEDLWQNPIASYLKDTSAQSDYEFDLTSASILYGALELDFKHQKRFDEMRVAKVMKNLGYEKQRKMLNGERKNVWVKCPT